MFQPHSFTNLYWTLILVTDNWYSKLIKEDMTKKQSNTYRSFNICRRLIIRAWKHWYYTQHNALNLQMNKSVSRDYNKRGIVKQSYYLLHSNNNEDATYIVICAFKTESTRTWLYCLDKCTPSNQLTVDQDGVHQKQSK